MALTTRSTTRSMSNTTPATKHPTKTNKVTKQTTANAAANASKKKKKPRSSAELEALLKELGGKKTPALKTSPHKTSKKGRCDTHSWECPICKSAFTRDRSLKNHFPGCVARNGNPNGHYYNDGEGRDGAKDVRNGGVQKKKEA